MQQDYHFSISSERRARERSSFFIDGRTGLVIYSVGVLPSQEYFLVNSKFEFGPYALIALIERIEEQQQPYLANNQGKR